MTVSDRAEAVMKRKEAGSHVIENTIRDPAGVEKIFFWMTAEGKLYKTEMHVRPGTAEKFFSETCCCLCGG